MMAVGKIVESDFDKWQRSSGGGNDLVWLSLDGDSRTIHFLLEGMDEFSVIYPPNYPQDDKARFSISASTKSLSIWVQDVNAWLAETSPKLTIADVLSKALELKKRPRAKDTNPALTAAAIGNAMHASKSSVDSEKPIARQSDDGDDEDEDEENETEARDDDMGVGDDKGGDFDLESEELKESLEILRLKKRWAKKESVLREEMRRKRDKELKSRDTDRAKTEQIFSTQAASGVLTNDLLSIMDNAETLGFSATPIDDNIYHWNAKLFKFKRDTETHKQLNELQRIYGYEYVELEISFTIDLYPFYPPQVKVIRPRFQGFMMGRITSMELLKLSYWDPVKDMKFVLNEIRNLIQEHGKIDVNNPMNNPREYPKGAYTDLEYLLLRLELLCETDPRANAKYPVQYQQPSRAKPALAMPSSPPAQSAAKPTSGQQQQDSTYWAKGTGYGFHGQSTWDVHAHLAAQREKDSQTELVLRGVLDFVTQPKISDASCEVLEESCLLPVLEQYLRNDSLLDISKHPSLYIVLFGLLRAFAVHENTVGLLDKLAFQKDSLAELIQALGRQANVFLKHTKSTLTSSDSSAQQQAIVLAEDIQKTALLVDNALSKMRADVRAMELSNFPAAAASASAGPAGGGVARSLSDLGTLAAVYARVLKVMQFDSCGMKRGAAYVHHYSAQLKGAQVGKEKILRLAQEQGTLMSSLPISHESSVFLRVDDERLDLMQALITGPVDTPYSGGCFTFHVFFPNTYPNAPPLVNLETTGGGTVRFNPNLYNCGKVCLSLLGTWNGAEGENWNKDTSTFLQVLVSIQSLIFVPKPFFNEPGYERQMGTPQGDEQSRKYNEVIRLGTSEHAILAQLRSPSPGFEEVIRTHFYLKSDVLRVQLDQWVTEAKTASNTAHYSRLLKAVKEIKEELNKLPPPKNL